MATTDSVPLNRPPMYSRSDGEATPGVGPSRLAFEVVPLPLTIQRVLPSRATRTEVGYQPAGMKPSGVPWAGSSTLKAATSLVLALATNRIDSSGERARALGV